MYNSLFYSHQESNQDTSPDIFKKFLSEKYDFSPSSVVDLGCGRGAFLKTFLDSGAKVYGIDGPWVPWKQLLIPAECFLSTDITKGFPKVRKVDLAICLEMAEHVPEKFSELIVDFLTDSADVIYFSAAIPSQGGAGHVNEQWQSYWADLFFKKGYLPNVQIREFVWAMKDYSPYYAQNGVIYAKDGSVFVTPKSNMTLNVVHPAIYNKKINRYKWLEFLYSKIINFVYR
jgi:SAM-dependent methyltransferase